MARTRQQILESLKAKQESSQGRIPVSRAPLPSVSPVEAFGRGLVRQATAPLDIVGLAAEPAYGPEGPGVAGTLGELVGSVAPYVVAEAAIARLVPLLAGATMAPRALRGGAAFGLVDLGREPERGETRARNALEGALMGATIAGVGMGSPLRAAGGAALATAIPPAIGGEVHAPVEMTGNEIADAAIFNAAVALGLYGAGKILPHPVETEATPPGPPPIPRAVPPPIPPSAPPSPSPRRVHYQPPVPTPPAEARVPRTLDGQTEVVAPRPTPEVEGEFYGAVGTAAEEAGLTPRSSAPEYTDVLPALGNASVLPNWFRGYREQILQSPDVVEVQLVGGQIRRGFGKDVDILYTFKPQSLESLEQAIERSNINLDLPKVDSFFRAGPTVYRMGTGAGRGLVELSGGVAQNILSGLPKAPEIGWDANRLTRQQLRELGNEALAEAYETPLAGEPGEATKAAFRRRLGMVRDEIRRRGFDPDSAGILEQLVAADRGPLLSKVPIAEQLSLPGVTREPSPPSPGPAMTYVAPGKIEQKLRTFGIRMPQTIPFKVTENLDPLAGVESGEWLGQIPAGEPVLLIRGLSKSELDASAKSGRLGSHRLLEDVPFAPTMTEEMLKSLKPDAPITWATADPQVAHHFGDHFVVFDAAGLPAYSSYRPTYGKLTRLPSHVDEAASVALQAEIPLDRIRFVGRWTEGADFVPVELGEFGFQRLAGRPTAQILPLGTKVPEVRLIRSAEEQAALEAQASIVRETARVTKGRLIKIDEEAAGSFAGLNGFDEATRTIDTTGLGFDDIDELVMAAENAGDGELVTTLGRTRAGLSKKAPGEHVPKRRTEVLAEEALASARAQERTPEELVLAREEAARLEETVDASDRAIGYLETRGRIGARITEPETRGEAAASRDFVERIDRIKQGRSGDVFTYSDYLRAAKDLHTPIVGMEGERFILAMPDKTLVRVTKEELEARVQAAIPPTTSVPVYTGPDSPPVPQAWVEEQLPLPLRVESSDLTEAARRVQDALRYPPESILRIRPIPEPAPSVVLAAAEREAGTAPSVADEVVAALDRDDPLAMNRFSREVLEALPESDQDRILAAIQRRTERRPKDRSIMMAVLPEEQAAILERRKATSALPPGVAERRVPAEPKKKPTKKPKVAALAADRGIARTNKRLPNRHKAAHIKGEAASKAIEIDESKFGIVVTDHVTGQQYRVKNLDEAAKIVSRSPNNEGPMRSEAEMMSFFRRRFAGAKSAKERNNIKKKYALYSAYFPQPGTPLLPGETPLRSLDGLVNRHVPPTRDLTPVEAGGGGRLTLPPDQVPIPPRGGPPIDPPLDFSRLWWQGLSRYWTNAKAWSLDVQRASGNRIAAYDRVFAPLFDGVQAFQRAKDDYLGWLVPAIKKAKGKDAGERITRYMEATDKAAAIRDFGLNKAEVEVAKLYREKLDEAFVNFGLKGEVPYVENYMQWRRANPQFTPSEALNTYWKGRAKPRSYSLIAELERETNGEWAREMDAHKLISEYFFRGLRKQHLAAPHAAAVEYVNSLPGNEPVAQHLAQFVNDAWGSSEMSRRALNTFFKGAMSSLGVPHTDQMRDDVLTVLQQLTTSSLMGWRAPLIIRNGIQIFFTYPLLGPKYFGVGLREAMTKEGQAAARKAFGIVGGPPVPGADEMYNITGILGRVTRSGLAGYAKVDDFTRIVAYLGTRAKVRDAGLRYLEHGNLAKFADEAELLSVFHPVEAQGLMKIAQSRDIAKLADRAGYLMQQNTNFIYNTANNPAAFRGVAGRLFGQFGVWPTSYIQYVKYLAAYGTPAQRSAKITRFLMMNTVFGSAGAMLGVNTWKWLMFGPAVFTGGPIAQTALDAAKVASNAVQNRDDPEAKLAASRLKRSVPGLFVPGYSAVRDIEAIAEATKRGPQAVLTRALTGQTPRARPVSPWPGAERRRELVESIRRRQQQGRPSR